MSCALKGSFNDNIRCDPIKHLDVGSSIEATVEPESLQLMAIRDATNLFHQHLHALEYTFEVGPRICNGCYSSGERRGRQILR